MKPANGNVLASLDQDKDEREALAASQWKLIHAFERGYLGKQVPNTSSNYEAEEWFDLNGSSRSRTGIKWSKVSGGPALKILAKAMTWDFIFDRSLEISTASLRLLSFQKMLLPVIESKKLLAGNPGEVLLGLSHITDDDLLVILDQQMVSMPRESQFLMQCMDLNGFVAYARHYGERVPEYLIRAQLPWQKSGETITAWAKRRIADKKFIFPSTEGYEPISGETAQHLV